MHNKQVHDNSPAHGTTPSHHNNLGVWRNGRSYKFNIQHRRLDVSIESRRLSEQWKNCPVDPCHLAWGVPGNVWLCQKFMNCTYLIKVKQSLNQSIVYRQYIIIRVQVPLSTLRHVLGGKGNKEQWIYWIYELFQDDQAAKCDFNHRAGRIIEVWMNPIWTGLVRSQSWGRGDKLK